jgi:hypothetical protein
VIRTEHVIRLSGMRGSDDLVATVSLPLSRLNGAVGPAIKPDFLALAATPAEDEDEDERRSVAGL